MQKITIDTINNRDNKKLTTGILFLGEEEVSKPKNLIVFVIVTIWFLVRVKLREDYTES